MARRSKPENETPEQELERRTFETVANHSDRSEKTSWNRKMDNMVTLLAKLRPIEEEIISLQGKKMPIFDEVQQLRELMVAECIHPYQHLVLTDEHTVTCKFCNRRIAVNHQPAD
jgi:L-lysine 2,3-aminomutase